MFALDRHSYARWLPVTLKLWNNFISLVQICKDFKNGKLIVLKSSKTFTCIALEQNYEQENVIIRVAGGTY